jgi:potassium efflux system protein
MSQRSIRFQRCSVSSGVIVCASLLATAFLAVALAQAAEEAEEVSLDDARQQLTAIQQRLAEAKTDKSLLELRAQALTLQSQLQSATSRVAPQVAQTESRIAQLGTAPQGTQESSDIVAQRRALEREHASLEGELKLAGLLSVEAEQVLTQISARGREQFRQRIGDRTSSPLGSAFWANFRVEAPQDARRAKAFARDVNAALRSASILGWVGVLLATVSTLAARVWLARKVPPLAPPGRLRRSLRAITHVVLWTLSAAIIASAIMLAVTSSDEVPPRLAGLLPNVAAAAVFGVYVAALGAALLSTRAPSWRLPAIDDEVAVELRRYGIQLAMVIILAALVEQIASAIEVSLRMSVALDGLTTLVLAVTLARGMRRGVQAHVAAIRRSSGNEVATTKSALPLWLAILIGIGWMFVVGGALCVLLGYIALGNFAVKQVAWASIVLCTAYLITKLIDDALVVVLTAARARFSPQSATSAKSAVLVLLSALARFTIAMLALALLLAPYGAGAIDLLPKFHRVQEGISIGALQLRPGPVIRGILILALGIAVVRLVRQWTEQRYLPATRMDTGMRATVTSLVGYVGYAIVIAFALSAMGVGLQQIAWVASALALGIGFGLQAIVQNFVSGLILMAERPIKVGDWVALSDFEGDVRRINARATEIQKLDRSTVIVPNSEFITKVVRNVTYANPLGRVQIRLPVRLGTDVERVRTELLQVFEAHSDILRTPAPSVMLDGIEAGNILFNARAFVISPRVVENVRSAILFNALVRLKEAGIELNHCRSKVPCDGECACRHAR